MSSLSDRLKELGVQVGASQLSAQAPANLPGLDLVDVIPGSWETTSRGDCFVVRKQIPRNTAHGDRDLSLDGPLNIFGSTSALKDISEIPISDFLFIDTETTGLAGGSGSYVFLIGAAKINRNQVEFAQFFLQDPGLESAQLSALESFVSSSRVLVSYNGKSFDLPRIRTRYRFHGWPEPFGKIYHLDLLHIARRIWRDHFPSCTLGELEHQLLGLERDNLDIPGWKVSEYFFQYLQGGDPNPLKNIFYHNEVDVLSLIALLGYIRDRLEFPLNNSELIQPAELLSTAGYLAAIQKQGLSAQVYKHLLSMPDLPPAIQKNAFYALAMLHKKKGELDNALPFWIESANRGSLKSTVELAKYFEHQQKDFQEALHWTLSAIELSDSASVSGMQYTPAALEHRLDRLRRKAKVSNQTSA